MKNTDKPLEYVALTFITEHQGEHLEHDRALLIDRCVAHLIDTQCVSKHDAEVAALQAYGERASRQCNAYVDVSLTTSHWIFIRDARNGMLRDVFTVADLDLLHLAKTPALMSLPAPNARAMPANGVDDNAGSL